MRRIRFSLFAAFVLLAGCRGAKSTESTTPDQPPALPVSAQTVARVHWLGMNQISGKSNTAHLIAIWNLPETRRLERQTLNKLSLAPWPLLHRNVDTNAAALLQPLLDDLVADESCLEIRQTSNPPAELVLAIRLDDQRAALWQTNLARVLESLTGIHPVPAPEPDYGWSLKKHHDPNFLELTRVGGWTIVGAAQDHNGLLDDLLARIRQGQPPLPAGRANDWLAADFDPARLASCLTTFAPQLLGATNPAFVGEAGSTAWRGEAERSRLNHLHLALTGVGTNVWWRGTADFSKPLALDLKPWNVPTSLVNWNPSSFTMVRGFRPWLESSPVWTNLQIGPPPDQACFWAAQDLQMQSCFTTPLADASNAVGRLANRVLQNQQRWFGTNDLAKFETSKTFTGLEWKGLPYMSPFLRSITISNQSFVYGGGFLNANIYPLSAPWLQAALGRTNLVYYDSEETGVRVEQWLYMGQYIRFILHKAQLPPQSPGLLWLRAIVPKLGDSVTDITQTGPNQLSFSRTSSLGFTAVELNLLADWLESSRFPIGLYTLETPPMVSPWP